jgi:hypothetical protein
VLDNKKKVLTCEVAPMRLAFLNQLIDRRPSLAIEEESDFLRPVTQDQTKKLA